MIRKALLAVPAVLLAGVVSLVGVYGSDHDDGETPSKGRSVNLTDLYVFREIDQNSGAAAGDLIFILNCNPRSLARQQYFFATNARYEFHVIQRTGIDDPVTAADDVILRFEFGAPSASNQQAITVTAIRNGTTLSTSTTTGGGAILTTALGSPDPAEINSDISLGGSTLTVFAGLREDPFFFDVERFFRVRAFALGLGPDPRPGGTGPLFRDSSTAADFTAGYNVNSIVVRVPIAFLQNGVASRTTFDVWETVSVLQ